MTKAERWANDYLERADNADLAAKYNLKAGWGDSLLAAMFEQFADEKPTHNICPECEQRRAEMKIKLEIMQDMNKAALRTALANTERVKSGFSPRVDRSEASVAQTAEQGFCKPEVGGSIPSAGSKLVYCDYHGEGVHEETPDCVGRVFKTETEVCTHQGYDTRTGGCYRCGKNDLPTVERNRRSISRFIDICRIALGSKGGNVKPYAYECLCQKTPHARVCVAWNDKRADEHFRESKIAAVGGTPNPCSVGSNPTSPAIDDLWGV